MTSVAASGLAWAVGAPEMVAVRAARAGVARMRRGRMSRGRGRMGIVARGGRAKARTSAPPLLQGEAGWGCYGAKQETPT